MQSTRRRFLMFGIAGLASLVGRVTHGQSHGGRGRNQSGRGRGAADPDKRADQNLIRTLIANRGQIRRQVKNLTNGVETLTETDNPQLRAVLIEHVKSMYQRVEKVRPIRLRDPLFAALFRKAKQISMKVEATPQGVQVIETSADPFTVKLIQGHAHVVSLFLKNGPQEVRKDHPVPE